MALPLIILAAAVCIANVHDGDSIRLCDGERVRIANIDAPEMPGSPSANAGATAGATIALPFNAAMLCKASYSAGRS